MDKFQTNTARSACSPLFDMQHARALPLCWLCVEVHTQFFVHPFLCWFCFVYFFDTPVSNADESVVVGCMCVSVFFLDWFCLSKQTPGFCQHLGCINLCDNFGALCACGVSGFFFHFLLRSYSFSRSSLHANQLQRSQPWCHVMKPLRSPANLRSCFRWRTTKATLNAHRTGSLSSARDRLPSGKVSPTPTCHRKSSVYLMVKCLLTWRLWEPNTA